MRNQLLYLAQQAFPSNIILSEPLIHQGCSRPEEELRQGRGGLDTKGDVFIQGWWEIQTNAIIGVRFGYADADTYKYYPMKNLLACCEKENKDKYSKNCY